MVVQGEFLIELVEAKTKKAFQEHEKDGKYYIEVEPDVEYFIHLRRIYNTQGTVRSQCCVDGQDLGYHHSWMGAVGRDYHAGLWEVKDGVSSHKSLKVIQPKRQLNDSVLSEWVRWKYEFTKEWKQESLR
jgi:hypothetical protein